MDVFNKLYTQVSSTVAQLSSVLPGNPVTREFEANTHLSSAGPELCWKIYKGYKRSTKQPASIFVFEKRQLEKYPLKSDRDQILDVLKRGIGQLTKIRHPQVLTVQHALEESRESLAFATEPVLASLANILGWMTNTPQPSNLNLNNYELYDIEIKYGLLQLSEGLAFLHNDMHLVHNNLNPASIIINEQGAWKIFGLDFSTSFNASYEDNASVPNLCQPNYEYSAPETVLNQDVTKNSDMFAFGMLIYAIFSRGKALFPIRTKSEGRERAVMFRSLSNQDLQCVPQDLQEIVKMLLNFTPDLRPDSNQFGKIKYFEDIRVKTLSYLDSILQWDNVQKSTFLKSLPESLEKLPHRVQLQRVVPCLQRELSMVKMVPFVLPSFFAISEHCSQEEFCKFILPYLKAIMRITEPPQILLIMLQKMELLLRLTPTEDIQQHVLPMLYRGLDSNSLELHELCLSVLPTFTKLLDQSSLKNSLVPRIKKLCLNTSNLSIRVNCLVCLGRILEHLDKWLVLDDILPFLPQIPSREPAVIMAILGIYKLTLNHTRLGITKELLANRIIPFLVPLCIENGLNLVQFNTLVVLIKEMFKIVENEHRTKLEQLNQVHREEEILNAAMPSLNLMNNPQSNKNLDFFKTTDLSLETKRQLAQQQNTMKVFSGNQQQMLKPITTDLTTTMSSKRDNSVKDLTQSLTSNDNWMTFETSTQAMTDKANWSYLDDLFPALANKSVPTTQNTDDPLDFLH